MLLSAADCILSFFFFNDTATTEIYTLSLHDALPISLSELVIVGLPTSQPFHLRVMDDAEFLKGEIDIKYIERAGSRSEEHTSELQSLAYLVCRLLLEKKKQVRKHQHLERRLKRACHS